MIEIQHKEWINDITPPALSAQDLNDNQQALEKCVEVANKVAGIKNVSKETEPNYPQNMYLAESSRLQDITRALNSKGVVSSGIFNNIPNEIKSIKQGGESEEIDCYTCEVYGANNAVDEIKTEEIADFVEKMKPVYVIGDGGGLPYLMASGSSDYAIVTKHEQRDPSGDLEYTEYWYENNNHSTGYARDWNWYVVDRLTYKKESPLGGIIEQTFFEWDKPLVAQTAEYSIYLNGKNQEYNTNWLYIYVNDGYICKYNGTMYLSGQLVETMITSREYKGFEFFKEEI